MLGAAVPGAAGVALEQGANPVTAVATLTNRERQPVGTASFTSTGTGVRVVVQAQGLPAGVHGLHVHEVGRCDPPAFTSAGGHFNPTGRQHGLSNPAGPHAGDLPNLTVASSGVASYVATSQALALASGPSSVFDADGAALVIHAGPDDDRTDPAGNSGERIACGVIMRGAAALPNTGSGPGGVAGALYGAAAALVAGAAAHALRKKSSG
jgi:Cu-Zn family superoxide dismutase